MTDKSRLVISFLLLAGVVLIALASIAIGSIFKNHGPISDPTPVTHFVVDEQGLPIFPGQADRPTQCVHSD